RAWLSNCLESHVGCKPESKSKLPTRVLDVSVANVGGSVHLCETKDEFGEYACLSHCWGPPGDSRVLRTVSETLSMFLEHIPWSSLPRNFRDTIDFVRALGIRYLWIDSLCIIQDDPLDWDRESAKMADIYANCVISIAAWTSAHADGGLFSNHNSLFRKIEFAHLTTADGERRPIYTRWHERHVLDARPVFFPLSTRAWVLQERLMAPRTVYFLGSEVGWECRKETVCECG
ncbi:HET-domain-containing protein, partial [Lizonia empirigonia]